MVVRASSVTRFLSSLLIAIKERNVVAASLLDQHQTAPNRPGVDGLLVEPVVDKLCDAAEREPVPETIEDLSGLSHDAALPSVPQESFQVHQVLTSTRFRLMA